MSFASDLKKFKIKTLDNYIKVKRLSAFDLFAAIILETPVDKGVLRNNWFAHIGRGSTEITDEQDKGGRKAIARVKNVLAGKEIAKDIFFTNNLPYAVPIEFDGISGKAPAGMVRINAARWEQIVSVNIRRVARDG